ncbi:SDR family oxidoreductase [Sphingomonas sp. AR_OL41]|uniref:SDR family NAD(P)-dependent oxidoreductase n=1 Tax=Sphingomonas sp. AR_OL41 TaxID=3042729 RepID=UPI0024811CD1|nr:SDR family oxidoreductase [Sphingomonas sp. AR_OL41]MDH7973907.1 SDR family oxidoreductase [Sphingomonas sp. AR_OL41]
MSSRLHGHVAVVTGAAGGIGSAIARRFASEGCRIAALDLVAPVDGDLNLTCDLGDDSAVEAAGVAIAAAGMSPSIVVHAAAMGSGADALDTDSAFLARMMNINVGGAFRLARIFAPGMRARQRGAFLFISSINSTFATPGLAAYAASKAALDSFTRTLALELAADRIRVNGIRPASIDTPLLRRGFEARPDPAAARRANILRHPLGRLGTPEDVAALALFLCSDEASWITGADYLLDGGASITRR